MASTGGVIGHCVLLGDTVEHMFVVLCLWCVCVCVYMCVYIVGVLHVGVYVV